MIEIDERAFMHAKEDPDGVFVIPAKLGAAKCFVASRLGGKPLFWSSSAKAAKRNLLHSERK